MSKNEIYEINKNIDKLYNRGYSNFINPGVFDQIKYKLRRNEYEVYYPYPDSDKVILYRDVIPAIRLFEIISYNDLTHPQILGSLFGLNINDDMFGDIVICDGKYYFYLMDEISDFIRDNLRTIGINAVKLIERPVNILDGYKKKYEEFEIIVSSLRIDTIVSRIIGISRDKIKDKINNKEIILNYDVLSNNSYILKDGDIFSIRRFGKYKFVGVIKITKKDNYIIKYLKYV